MDIKKKNNISYKFQTPDLKSLLDLAARATLNILDHFKQEFGKILNVLLFDINGEVGSFQTLTNP